MKKIIIKTILFLGLLFIGLNNVHADEAFVFSIGGATDVKAGDEFEVDVNVKGPSEEYTLNGYNILVSYDVNKLDLLSGASDDTVSANNVAINNDEKLATLRFRVKDGVGAGSTNLSLSVASVLQNGDELNKKDITTNGGNVKIRNIGSDSSLKSLKIPNTVISPSFKSDVKTYTATVTDVTSVDIKAEPNESHATVYITENSKNLVKGLNEITVVCKAENGTETSYNIKITLNVTPTEEELKLQDTSLKSLSIKGQKIEFDSNEKKYYINVDYDVTKINITALPTNANAEVKITGNSKLIVGKNTVKISVTSEDKTKTDTYQIIVTRAEENKKLVKTCPDLTSTKEWIIFTISLLVTFTLGIVLGYFLGKKDVLGKIFSKKKKEETPVEVETLSDTIDLSDTSKLVNDSDIETIDTEIEKIEK
jgi:hypothetical protein